MHYHHEIRPSTPPASPSLSSATAAMPSPLSSPPLRSSRYRKRHRHVSPERPDGIADHVCKKRSPGTKSVRSPSVKVLASAGPEKGLKAVDSTIERIFKVLAKPGADRSALGIFSQSLKLFVQGMPATAARLNGRSSTNLDLGKLAGLAADVRSALYLSSLPVLYKKIKTEFGSKAKHDPNRDRVGHTISRAAPLAELSYVLSNMLSHVAAKDVFYKHSDPTMRALRNGKLLRANGTLHIFSLLIALAKMLREAQLDKEKGRILAMGRRTSDSTPDKATMRAGQEELTSRRKKRHKQYLATAFYLPAALGRALKHCPWPDHYNWLLRLLAQAVKMHTYWHDTK